MCEEARSEVLELMKKKDQLEDQIKVLTEVLKQNNIGMKEPLVDSEGYPLSNIDVYQVRMARNKIICLQNDHKAIMKQIEDGLAKYYGSSNRSASDSSASGRVVEAPAQPVHHAEPIAVVKDVTEGSPADEAGLRNDDMIYQFGSLNMENFKDVNMIADVVKNSENMNVKLQIKRSGNMLNVQLKPRKWQGRGLLGCRIVQLENVDR